MGLLRIEAGGLGISARLKNGVVVCEATRGSARTLALLLSEHAKAMRPLLPEERIEARSLEGDPGCVAPRVHRSASRAREV